MEMLVELNSLIKIAVLKGLEYVSEKQSPEGCWLDYMLEPGSSDSWVTAYCAGCLCEISRKCPTEQLSDALLKAAAWLDLTRRTDGGWGYNSFCRTDSDSTAYAVLCQHKVGQPVSETSYVRLRRFQQADGGFATFDKEFPGDSWGISHPDVSAVVVRALLTGIHPSDDAVQRWHSYAVSHLGANGLWPSFWWQSSLYSTYVHVDLFEELGLSYDRRAVREAALAFDNARGAFATALLGEIIALLAPRHSKCFTLSEALLRSQKEDGSWAPSATMRVTNRDCARPWMNPTSSGQYVVDVYRILTTSTVLRFLSRCYNGGD